MRLLPFGFKRLGSLDRRRDKKDNIFFTFGRGDFMKNNETAWI